MSSTNFIKFLAGRRSYYALERASTIPDDKIQKILGEVLHTVPSSFNSQTTRLVLLVNEDHEKLWSIAKEVLLAAIGPEAFANSEAKLNSFKGAYGTVLFFEDQKVVNNLMEQFALYADHFPIWSEQTSGMHQLAVWTALEAEGLGANLQHYNPLIDERVATTWNVPASWKLRAQLVFGKPVGDSPAEKPKLPLEETLKAYGASK